MHYIGHCLFKSMWMYRCKYSLLFATSQKLFVTTSFGFRFAASVLGSFREPSPLVTHCSSTHCSVSLRLRMVARYCCLNSGSAANIVRFNSLAFSNRSITSTVKESTSYETESWLYITSWCVAEVVCQ